MAQSETKGAKKKLFGQTSSLFDVVLLFLILLVGAVMGLVWHSYQSNTSAIFDLAEDLSNQVNATVSQKTKQYLVPGPIMTELGSRISSGQAQNLEVDSQLSELMLEVLKLHEQLIIFSVGNEDGDFMMHMRRPDGTISTKVYDRSGKEPKLYWYDRNEDGELQPRRQEPFDGYDPRERPWYIGAKERRGRFWSDVYIFHTSQSPGITASYPIFEGDEVVGAFGLDIPLEGLSNFVARQRIGDNGATFLINEHDQLVAAPDKTTMVGPKSGQPRLMNVAEYDHQALTKAWRKRKTTGRERVSVEVDGDRWIASFQGLSAALNESIWTIAVLVPEADLIGAITKNNKYRFAVSLSVLFAALVVGFALRHLKTTMALQSRFIRQTFGRYLSDDIVTALLEEPEGLELGGQNRTITVLMTDLRGFTAMSERMPAEEVVAILNDYLSEMAEIIMKWGGTIDEFIGDAILAMFGAPFAGEDDPQRAVACALEMQLAMDRVNAKNREKGYPDLAMGIGINTGEVVVGNVGSVKRTKYGIVGQNVNLTARIESYTVGSEILISETTRKACGDLLTIAKQMEVTPKGVPKPLSIFEVRGIGGDYNVTLPEPEAAAKTELDPPLGAGLAVLEGKDAGTASSTCRILAIDANMQCEITAETLLALHDNLKLTLTLDHHEGELYAKVVAEADARGRVTVALTAVPPEIETALRNRLDA